MSTAVATNGRGAKVSDVELMLVARAWVAASEDPIKGKGQKRDHFNNQFVANYASLCREHIKEQKPGHERIIDRGAQFPIQQWPKIRRIVDCFVAVRIKWPRGTGESNTDDYNDKIRPKVLEMFKAKKSSGLPSTCPKGKYEELVDYLSTKPKFKLLGQELEKRPAGKRGKQQEKKLREAKTKVMRQMAPSENESELSSMLLGLQKSNADTMTHALAHDEWKVNMAAFSQQQQTIGMISATNPSALPAFFQFQERLRHPGPAPKPPPPAAAVVRAQHLADAVAPAAAARRSNTVDLADDDSYDSDDLDNFGQVKLGVAKASQKKSNSNGATSYSRTREEHKKQRFIIAII